MRRNPDSFNRDGQNRALDSAHSPPCQPASMISPQASPQKLGPCSSRPVQAVSSGILSAPREANINHLGTAFGGRLHALAVLSGSGLLWLELQDAECHIVIRKSTIAYERPVRGEFRAICARPGADALEEFKQTFHQKGKARIALSATIEDQGETVVRFEGIFVAMR